MSNLTKLSKLNTLRALKNHRHFNKASAGAAIILFAAIGTILLFRSHAATPFASLEPEQGAKTPNVAIISDPTASGNSAVQFGSAPTASNGICTNRDAAGGVPAGTFPGAACTGIPPGTALTAYTNATGPNGLYYPTDGEVINDKTINGSICLAGGNRITIARSKIFGVVVTASGQGALGCNGAQYTGMLQLTDVEIDGQNIDSGGTSLSGNFSCIRCNLHGHGKGVQIDGDRPFSLIDSWIHDLYGVKDCSLYPQDCISHNETIWMQTAVQSSVVIRHNNLDGSFSSASTGGGMSASVALYYATNTIVENNLISAPQAIYCIYGGSSAGRGGPATNVQFLNNRIKRGCNPVTDYVPGGGNVWSGNVWDDTGALIP